MTLHPTKTRLRFADQIGAGRIRWYNFLEPEAWHTITGRKHTADLDEFFRAGLAEVAPCPGGVSTIAQLTTEGMAWVTRARIGSAGRASAEVECPHCRQQVQLDGPLDDGGRLMPHQITHEARPERWCPASRQTLRGFAAATAVLSALDGPVSTSPETGPRVLVSGEPHDPAEYCETCRGYRDDPHDCARRVGSMRRAGRHSRPLPADRAGRVDPERGDRPIMRCIATENLTALHDYEPGTRKQHDALYYDGYSICGRGAGNAIHKGACPLDCGRPGGKGDDGYCCKRCEHGMSDHTDKCDQRAAKVNGDDD